MANGEVKPTKEFLKRELDELENQIEKNKNLPPLLKLQESQDIIDDGSDSEDESKGPAELAREEGEEEEEEEVEEVEIDGKDYYTNDSNNGNIYEVLEDGDPGDKIGWYENGIAFFS